MAYAIPSGLVPLPPDRDRFGFKNRFYKLNNVQHSVPMLLVQPAHQLPFLMDVRTLTYGECKSTVVGKALVLMDPNYYDEQAKTRPDDYLSMPIRKVTRNAVLDLAKSYDSRLELPTADHYLAAGVRINVLESGEILNGGGVFLGGKRQDPALPSNPAFPIPYSARFVLILEKMAR